jgi:hypothetical protein
VAPICAECTRFLKNNIGGRGISYRKMLGGVCYIEISAELHKFARGRGVILDFLL